VFLDEGRIEIGDRVWIGPGVHIYGVEHMLEVDKRSYIKDVPVFIEDDVWIGGHATILPGVRLGKGCVVGAGSVVTKDVKSNTLWYGNPAKQQGFITNEGIILDMEMKDKSGKHYKV